jgi:hypothetical protein
MREDYEIITDLLRIRDDCHGAIRAGGLSDIQGSGRRWQLVAVQLRQLRRNTDRKTCHRHAAICLAVTALIVGKLITYRDRHCLP